MSRPRAQGFPVFFEKLHTICCWNPSVCAWQFWCRSVNSLILNCSLIQSTSAFVVTIQRLEGVYISFKNCNSVSNLEFVSTNANFNLATLFSTFLIYQSSSYSTLTARRKLASSRGVKSVVKPICPVPKRARFETEAVVDLTEDACYADTAGGGTRARTFSQCTPQKQATTSASQHEG